MLKLITGVAAFLAVRSGLQKVIPDLKVNKTVPQIMTLHSIKKDFPEVAELEIYNEIRMKNLYDLYDHLHNALMDPCAIKIEKYQYTTDSRKFLVDAYQQTTKCGMFGSCNPDPAYELTKKWEALVKASRSQSPNGQCEKTPVAKEYSERFFKEYNLRRELRAEECASTINIASAVAGVAAAGVAGCARDKLRNKISQLRRERTNRP